MTTSPDATPTPPRRWRALDAEERRVLGTLIEKAKTTPAGYPMTVNALVTGCNQRNNREPLTAYRDLDVEKAIDRLRTSGVVEEIDWMGRAAKYKHLAYDWFGVSRAGLAVLGELLLRGEQTLGDLRARAARMEPIADMTELKPIVDGLVARGLVVELTPPGRGQVVTHGCLPPAELEAARARAIGVAVAAPAVASPAAASAAPGLEAEVATLRAELAALGERVRALEERAGG